MAILIPGGGGNEIGGSYLPVVFDDTVVAFDCGGRPLTRESRVRALNAPELPAECRRKREPWPDLDVVPKVNHLLLSHGHLDHVLATILLYKKNPQIKIYATGPTVAFMNFLYTDMIKRAFWQEKETGLPSDLEFTDRERQELIDSVIEIPYRNDMPVIRLSEKISVKPVKAGHILGAVSYFVIENGRVSGFYSGDISYHDQQTIAGAPRFAWDELDFAIVDSTRIAEKSQPREEIEQACMDMIRKSFEEGFSVRLLVFAIARAQEAFRLAIQACPKAPIWLDGSAQTTSLIYSKYSEETGIGDNIGKHFVQDRDQRRRIINGGPNIVIVPSAMQFGGVAAEYARTGISKSDHLFINIGYLDPCAPEHAFFTSKPGDAFAFNGETVPRLCQTGRFNLTAHMDRDDILEMRERIHPTQTILAHGEDAKQDKFIAEHPDMGFVKAVNNQPLKI